RHQLVRLGSVTPSERSPLRGGSTGGSCTESSAEPVDLTECPRARAGPRGAVSGGADRGARRAFPGRRSGDSSPGTPGTKGGCVPDRGDPAAFPALSGNRSYYWSRVPRTTGLNPEEF